MHLPWVVSQSGVLPPQSAFERHARHRPEEHVPPVQPASAPHCTQPSVASQTGSALEHWLFAVQLAHVLVVASQTAALVEQSLAERQPTQRPAVRSQTGVKPPHWALDVQFTQLPASRLQAPPSQSAEPRQPEQRPASTLHSGVAPMQALVAGVVHCTQAPLSAHAGASAGHWLDDAQATHACAEESQIGVAPLHESLNRQPTQTPGAVSQIGVAPPHPAFERQATQCPCVVSHSGVDPAQSEFARH